jgi:hypothetical protein
MVEARRLFVFSAPVLDLPPEAPELGLSQGASFGYQDAGLSVSGLWKYAAGDGERFPHKQGTVFELAGRRVCVLNLWQFAGVTWLLLGPDPAEYKKRDEERGDT